MDVTLQSHESQVLLAKLNLVMQHRNHPWNPFFIIKHFFVMLFIIMIVLHRCRIKWYSVASIYSWMFQIEIGSTDSKYKATKQSPKHSTTIIQQTQQLRSMFKVLFDLMHETWQVVGLVHQIWTKDQLHDLLKSVSPSLFSNGATNGTHINMMSFILQRYQSNGKIQGNMQNLTRCFTKKWKGFSFLCEWKKSNLWKTIDSVESRLYKLVPDGDIFDSHRSLCKMAQSEHDLCLCLILKMH